MINAVVAGRGEPLLILHGLFGNLDNYRSIALHFERYHQVHRIDLPGHGDSTSLPELSIQAMAAEIQHYLEQNHIEHCSVLGHSLGGKVAMALASSDPQRRIKKLIIVDIAPRLYPPHHEGILNALSALDLNSVSDRRDADKLLRATIPEAGVRAFLLKSLIRDKDKDENSTALRWQFDLEGLKASYDAIREMPTMTKAIAIPSLFIKGGNSDYIREADAELIKRHFSAVTLKEIPGAGHWVHAEKPAVFSSLCTEFLQANNS